MYNLYEKQDTNNQALGGHYQYMLIARHQRSRAAINMFKRIFTNCKK
ncbi:hypothetical protein [Polycladidibacter stylochi]|nr:hypothetical protein [Pseudovibrio stylochi]